jgi:uncharacterized protein
MHDSRRYHYLTGNSFDKVFKNIGFALNNNVSVSVRFNVDANNFGEIQKLKDLFDAAGYSQKKHFDLNTALLRKDETCVSPESSLYTPSQEKTSQENTSSDDNILYLSRDEFNLLHKKAGMEVTLQDYGLYYKLFTAIKYGTYLRFHSIFCGVQAHLYIFDPYGYIYNCWEAVGIKNHILGNYTKKVTWTEELKNWQERNVGTTPQCSICKYALLCGGGCIAKALRLSNGLGFKASYCDNYGDILKITVNKIYKDWQQNLLTKEDRTESVKKEI